MTTNLVLFLACAPLWLLVVTGAALSAAVLLPLASAGLPAFALRRLVRFDEPTGQVNPAPGAHDVRFAGSNGAVLA
jgi:hypothetical protein